LRWGWAAQFGLWSAVLAAEALAMGLLAWPGNRSQGSGIGGQESGVVPPDSPGVSSLTAAFCRPLARFGEWLGWAVIALGVWSGWRVPWPFVHVVQGGCLLAVYMLLTVEGELAEAARLAG